MTVYWQIALLSHSIILEHRQLIPPVWPYREKKKIWESSRSFTWKKFSFCAHVSQSARDWGNTAFGRFGWGWVPEWKSQRGVLTVRTTKPQGHCCCAKGESAIYADSFVEVRSWFWTDALKIPSVTFCPALFSFDRLPKLCEFNSSSSFDDVLQSVTEIWGQCFTWRMEQKTERGKRLKPIRKHRQICTKHLRHILKLFLHISFLTSTLWPKPSYLAISKH